MVAALTVGKKGYEPVAEAMKELGLEAQSLKDAFREDVDRDTDAFNDLYAAMKMKKATPEQAAERDAAILSATKAATEIPLGVLERTVRAAELAAEVARSGNRNSLSDAGVAALAARGCAEGAYYNVLINLDGLPDPDWVAATRRRARAALDRVIETTTTVGSEVTATLETALTEPQEA
jgi:glutamate formiminotransferase/formiminotetrahydrofolate cyclodeaminase